MATRFIEHVDPIQDQINEIFDRIVKCANLRRSVLLTKLTEKRAEMALRTTEVEQQLIDTKQDIIRTIKDKILGEFQERILAEIENKLSEVRQSQPKTDLEFEGDSEHLEHLISGLGEILEKDMPPAIPHYKQLKRTLAVGSIGHNPGELSYPRGVAIDADTNHIYVTDRDPAKVSVFSASGEHLVTFTHELMRKPYGVTIHKDNVYATDTGIHGVFHFKKHAGIHFISRLTGQGSAPGNFYNPRQLTVAADGDVFVADCYNHRIQILDDSLNYERSIEHKSMHDPQDVKLTNDEVYVLSRTDSPCVHAFSYDGEKIRSFITCGGEMQVTVALFFCMDAQENILISDGGTNSVKVFSPDVDGTLVHNIEGFVRGEYYSPRGIALTKLMKLVVIDPNDNCKLHIY